jgi:hypothetical protein
MTCLLPGPELHKYLTNSISTSYSIPYTFAGVLQHLKYSAAFSKGTSPDINLTDLNVAFETILAALKESGVSSQNNFSSLYGMIITQGSDFYSGSTYTSLLAQLCLIREDTLLKLYGMCPRTGELLFRRSEIEAHLKGFWKSTFDKLFSLGSESFLNLTDALKKAFSPNIHLSIWTGLKTPQFYLPGTEKTLSLTLSQEYPDICISYRTLLSFPRVVNVHDWASSFASVLSLDLERVSGRFIYCVKAFLLMGIVKRLKKAKQAVPDFVERCNLGDSLDFDE